jgi:hypothetical protein
VQHPVCAEKHLYALMDPPHLGKNLRTSALLYHLKIPEDVAKKHGLLSNVVDVHKTCLEIVKRDEMSFQKLAPRLKRHHLDMNKNHYNKMRVPGMLVVSMMRYLTHMI